MRAIETTTQYRRDFKKHGADSGQILDFIKALAEDRQLPASVRDHALKGKWAGYRECHIRPDLLLIYKKPDDRTLRLARVGAHGPLFG